MNTIFFFKKKKLSYSIFKFQNILGEESSEVTIRLSSFMNSLDLCIETTYALNITKIRNIVYCNSTASKINNVRNCKTLPSSVHPCYTHNYSKGGEEFILKKGTSKSQHNSSSPIRV